MRDGLFDVDEVRKAAEKLNLSDRGSDEGYNLVAMRELYLMGKVGVEVFVHAILNTEDGDRRRRMIMAMYEKGNGDTDEDEMNLQRAFGPHQRRCWEDEE